MKVYEFGKEHAKTFVMFQCAAEPWWVFRASAEEIVRRYRKPLEELKLTYTQYVVMMVLWEYGDMTSAE